MNVYNHIKCYDLLHLPEPTLRIMDQPDTNANGNIFLSYHFYTCLFLVFCKHVSFITRSHSMAAAGRLTVVVSNASKEHKETNMLLAIPYQLRCIAAKYYCSSGKNGNIEDFCYRPPARLFAVGQWPRARASSLPGQSDDAKVRVS
jgi:hypothetical protein